MNTIIAMPAPRQGRPVAAGQEGGATILFFTGVRYMRDVPVASALDAEHDIEGREEPSTDAPSRAVV